MSSLSDRLRNSKIIGLSSSKDFSLEVLFDDFEKALNGKAKPDFLIFPSEPGKGKSRGVQKFLSEFKSRGFTPGGQGIIIFLSTKKEISDYISGVMFSTEDYAVLDSQSPIERVKMFGGSLKPDSAPILFMTTQLLYSRCGDSFDQFEAAFFKGKPRSLRIWDEEFKPANTETVSVDEIAQMRVALRADFPNLAIVLQNFESQLHAAMPDSELAIPTIPDCRTATMRGILTSKQGSLLQSISDKSGRVSASSSFNSIVVERRRLPNDLAPLFVLDASARVCGNYDIMKKSGLNVKITSCLPHSYGNANFYFMKMGVGRSSLAKSPSIRERMLIEVTEKINEDRDEPIIVIYNNVRGVDIPSMVSGMSTNPHRIEYVKWGDHKASNKYRHIKKVICLGMLRLPKSGYTATHMGCVGRAEDQATDNPRIRKSHILSSMLQAFARSNMRNGVDGDCGECSIYIVDSEILMPNYLRDTFPGCNVSEWKRITSKISKTQIRILSYLNGHSRDKLIVGIKRTTIYNDLEIDKSNFSRLIKSRDFQIEASRMSFIVEQRCIRLDASA